MTQLHDLNIESIQQLAAPSEFLKEFPTTAEMAAQVTDGREQVARILKGEDNRMLMIVGPCSLHDIEAGYEYAEKLKSLADEMKNEMLVVMRVYFEKPRTTVGWKGLIYDPHLNGSFDINTGLRMAREFLLKVSGLGLLTAIEFVDPITPQYIADLYSWAAIGARTAESQTHRQVSSGLSMPVGFKNGTGGSIQLAVDGVTASKAAQAFLGVDSEGKASVVVTKGNPHTHIVLRGGNNGPNYNSESIKKVEEYLKKANIAPHKIMIDCSHGNSNKNYKNQPNNCKNICQQISNGNKNIIGIMIESNLNEGKQKLILGKSSELLYGISITDSCINIKITENLMNIIGKSVKIRRNLN